jgi:hypothetical protein
MHLLQRRESEATDALREQLRALSKKESGAKPRKTPPSGDVASR